VHCKKTTTRIRKLPIWNDRCHQNIVIVIRMHVTCGGVSTLRQFFWLILVCSPCLITVHFVYAEKHNNGSKIIRATRSRSLNTTTTNFRQPTALLRLLPDRSQPEVALYSLPFPVWIKTHFRCAGQVLTASDRRRGCSD